MLSERENVFSMLLTAVFSSLLCSHGGKSFTCDVVVVVAAFSPLQHYTMRISYEQYYILN